VTFNPFAPATVADPHPAAAALRESHAVAHLPELDVWAITRHADVKAALRDHGTFSSVGGPQLVPGGRPAETGIIISSDPPMHTRVRKAIARFFTPRSMAQLEAGIRSRTTAAIDRLLAGEADAIEILAEPVPVHVFCDLMGLGLDGREDLPRFADAVFDLMGPAGERTAAAMARMDEFGAYVMGAATGGGFTEGSIGAHIFGPAVADGELDLEEAISLFAGVLVAGMDTTSNFLGNALHLFATEPEQWQHLRDDPSGIDAACDEVLRHEAPVQYFFRHVAQEVTIGDDTIPEGARAMLMYGSANRDPRQFDDPDRFDIGRPRPDHVAFGHGIHLCLGAPLARLEGRVVLEELVARVAHLEPAGPAERKQVNVIRGFRRLPLRAS
jgi:4-methoxybenzoate monooxygenase (O-demethylating)